MRNKILIAIPILASYIYCLYLVYFESAANISNNVIFAIISISSLFVLPAVISKLVTKKSYFGVGYILSTLIYPLTYLLIYLLTKWLNLDSHLLYRAIGYTFLSFTAFSLLFLIFKKDIKNYISLRRGIFLYICVFVFLISIYFLLGIKTNALLGTDFLQHNAVALEMANGRLCLTPNQCSELFQKLGYTTYFHSMQVFSAIGFGISVGLASTIFNFAFVATSSLVVASILSKYLKNKYAILLGTLATISIFEIGAYSFSFIIPQTFTLLLFLNILAEKKLKASGLLFSIPILIANHFIFGPIFAVFASIYYLFVKLLRKQQDFLKVLAMVAMLAAIIAFLANFRGFSIEKFFQLSDVAILGGFSNYYFPENISFLFTQYGFLLILFIIATIYTFVKKKSQPFTFFSIFYVYTCLTLFFLAPTYASKFLIGSSFFMMFIIAMMLKNLKLHSWLFVTVFGLVLVSNIPFYMTNLKKYTTFYTQNTGEISGFAQEDKDLIKYLSTKELNCEIVSDPYTQLMVRGNTNYETAGAQYQGLETRKAIINFIQNPTDENYEGMLSQHEISNRFCFVYTSRMEAVNRYHSLENVPWINNLYEYEIDNNYGINNQKFTDFMLKKGFHIAYSDTNNILFVKE